MKTLEYVIKKTALEMGLPESTVRPIVMEYWRNFSENLLKLKATTTSVRHVGNFAVARYKLYKYLRKMIRKIKAVRKSENMSAEKKAEALELYYNQLRPALRERNILAHHYQKMFKQNVEQA